MLEGFIAIVVVCIYTLYMMMMKFKVAVHVTRAYIIIAKDKHVNSKPALPESKVKVDSRGGSSSVE